MDLASLTPIEKRFNVKHPRTGEPTGMILTLGCMHSPKIRAAVRKINDQIIRHGADMDPAKEVELDAALVAAHITDIEFEGEANWHGKKPAYTPELAREVCSLQAIKDQVVKEVQSVRDFYPA